MRKTNKKGFTIVELVIVIAVIAILAAVLIPTFASIIKKANESADIQAARQMNTALAAESITEKPETFYEVIEILSEAGFNSEKALKPATKGCAFYWYKPENLIVLANIEEAEATAQVASILILPVSAADDEESPVSILYPFPEDHTEKLINDIIAAIMEFLPDHDSNIIFDLESGKDFLNALNSGNITRVTGVTLDKTTLDMTINQEEHLTATLTPENPTFNQVTWSSSDDEVAEVDADGLVTAVKAVKAGTAIITVTTEDGGYKATCTVTVNHEHSYTTVVTEPTCTERGYTTYICSCGDSYVDDYVDALGHTEVTDAAVAPTCTETGRTEGKHCSVCDTVLVARETVDALGHDKVSHDAQDPTCTESGWDAYETCSRCDYTTYAEKAALGHTPGAEATCTTAQTCTVCGDTLAADKGHTEAVDAAVAATCTETGLTEGKHCSVCGEVIVAQTVVDKIDHSFGDWETTKEATWTENGEQQRKCTVCGATETQAIEAKCNTGEISSLTDLQDALSAGNNELNLTLTQEITINKPITIAEGKNVTIDLNEKKLILEDPSTAEKAFHVIQVFGTLNINDNTKAGEIVINSENGNNFDAYFLCGICIGDPDGEVAGGELNLNGVKITGNRECNIENYASTSLKNVAFTVNCGTGLYSAAGTVYINDSTLVAAGDADTQIYCKGGTMDITGTEEIGTKFVESGFNGYSDNYLAPICVTGEGTKVTLGNVTVETNNGANNIRATDKCTVEIKNGTFNGPLFCAGGSIITIDDGTFNDVICTGAANVTINGGTFKSVTCNSAVVTINGGTFTEKFVFDGQEFFIYIKAYTEDNIPDDIKDDTICGVPYEQLTKDSDIFVKAVAAVPDIEMNKTYEEGFWTIGRKDTIRCKDHTGGKATCTERAKCEKCGEPHGELANHTDADNDGDHICDRTGCNADNVTEHTYGDLIGKKAATCSETGMSAHYKCSECSKLFNEYKVAKTEADLTIAIDENAHAYGDWTSTGNGTHTRVCSLNNAHTENGNCAGGTASCTQKAVCTTCKAEYGNLADHTYDDDEWAYDEGGHWQVCTVCDTPTQKEVHSDGKTCSVCGKVKLPDYTTLVISGSEAKKLDEIKISENSGKTFTTDDNTFSVSFWLQSSSIPTNAVIFTNQSGLYQGGYGFYFNEKGQLTFFASEGRGYQELYFTKALNVSNWTHITCVVNVNTVTVYVNGEKVGDKTSNDEAGAITASTLRIGQYTGGSGTFSSETYMDEYMVFDRCISAEEVKQIYDYYPQN